MAVEEKALIRSITRNEKCRYRAISHKCASTKWYLEEILPMPKNHLSHGYYPRTCV